MSALRVGLGLDAVRVEGRSTALATSVGAHGGGESALEPLWRAVRDGIRAAAAGGPGPWSALELAGAPGVLAIWDADTLGAARPALTHPGGPAAGAAWIAAHEPHVWVHVSSGRDALGPLEAYVCARLTRGAWGAVAPEAAWSSDVLGALEALGVPDDALPDVTAAPPARTDPRLLDGLDVPIRLAAPLHG